MLQGSLAIFLACLGLAYMFKLWDCWWEAPCMDICMLHVSAWSRLLPVWHRLLSLMLKASQTALHTLAEHVDQVWGYRIAHGSLQMHTSTLMSAWMHACM